MHSGRKLTPFNRSPLERREYCIHVERRVEYLPTLNDRRDVHILLIFGDRAVENMRTSQGNDLGMGLLVDDRLIRCAGIQHRGHSIVGKHARGDLSEDVTAAEEAEYAGWCEKH
jgi:hypothetical protein